MVFPGAAIPSPALAGGCETNAAPLLRAGNLQLKAGSYPDGGPSSSAPVQNDEIGSDTGSDQNPRLHRSRTLPTHVCVPTCASSAAQPWNHPSAPSMNITATPPATP